MPRILIFIGSLTGGGAERVAVALSRYLVEQGDEVRLATMHDSSRDFYVLDPRVERASLSLAGVNRGVGKLTANLGRLRALRRQIRQWRPNVVVGFQTNDAVLTILACIGMPARSLVSERNFPGRKKVPGIWHLLRRATYRFADAHAVQTERTAAWLKRHTGARNVHVVPNSVKWPIAAVPPEVAPDSLLPPDAKLLLAVGSKPHQKGFDLLIDAFAGLARRFPDWVLAIPGIDVAGASQNREIGDLLERIAARDLRDRVLFPGRVGNVGDWYERADLFVLSSRYEGIPNVLLEAMASGTASIAFDCETGPGDIIRHGEDGILVPSADIGVLVREMGRLMSDASQRKALGMASLAVRDRFSEARILGLWKHIIDAA